MSPSVIFYSLKHYIYEVIRIMTRTIVQLNVHFYFYNDQMLNILKCFCPWEVDNKIQVHTCVTAIGR